MYADLIELDGTLSDEMHEYLNGKYTFWQKLKNGGTGSPKIVYVSGNAMLDIAAEMSLDINYANIELFPQGLAVRLYKINKLAAVVIRKEEITSLTTYTKLLDNARLYLKIECGEEKLIFNILPNNEKAFFRFLKHPWFKPINVENYQVI